MKEHEQGKPRCQFQKRRGDGLRNWVGGWGGNGSFLSGGLSAAIEPAPAAGASSLVPAA